MLNLDQVDWTGPLSELKLSWTVWEAAVRSLFWNWIENYLDMCTKTIELHPRLKFRTSQQIVITMTLQIYQSLGSRKEKWRCFSSCWKMNWEISSTERTTLQQQCHSNHESKNPKKYKSPHTETPTSNGGGGREVLWSELWSTQIWSLHLGGGGGVHWSKLWSTQIWSLKSSLWGGVLWSKLWSTQIWSLHGVGVVWSKLWATQIWSLHLGGGGTLTWTVVNSNLKSSFWGVLWSELWSTQIWSLHLVLLRIWTKIYCSHRNLLVHHR